MFSNAKMQVPNNMNKLLERQQVGLPVNGANNKKAYEMIKSALGHKDGLTYSNFSNVFTLQGTGNAKMGITCLAQKSRQAGRSKGTTVSDSNKAQNDLILS